MTSKFLCLAIPVSTVAILSLMGCGGNSVDQPEQKVEPVQQALPVYRIELPNLNLPGKTVVSSVVFNINAANELTGTLESQTGRHAYYWSQGNVSEIVGFDSSYSDGIGYNINRHGRIVGSFKTGNTRSAFSWQYGDLKRLPNLPGASFSDAFHLNDVGEVVGVSGSPELQRAVFWQGSQVIALKLLNEAVPVSSAFSINNAHVIAGGSATATGYKAVIWTDPNTVIDLGSLPGAREEYGTALALNQKNDVVGVTAAKNGRHAFLWQAGKMTDLGDLPGGDELSIAFDVNDHAHVVGSSQVKAGISGGQSATDAALSHHAFLWTAKTGMLDLNALVDPNDPLKSSVTLIESAIITNDGTITGRALVGGKVTGYVLRPLKYPL